MRARAYLLDGSEIEDLIHARRVDEEGHQTGFKDQRKVGRIVPVRF